MPKSWPSHSSWFSCTHIAGYVKKKSKPTKNIHLNSSVGKYDAMVGAANRSASHRPDTCRLMKHQKQGWTSIFHLSTEFSFMPQNKRYFSGILLVSKDITKMHELWCRSIPRLQDEDLQVWQTKYYLCCLSISGFIYEEYDLAAGQ